MKKTKIISKKITQLVSGLKDCPCGDPIVHSKVNEKGHYVVYGHVYLVEPVKSVAIKDPSSIIVKTVADPEASAVYVLIQCEIEGKPEPKATYSLWSVELEYSIEVGIFLPFIFVNTEVKYSSVFGPETKRGTVTTPKDPDDA